MVWIVLFCGVSFLIACVWLKVVLSKQFVSADADVYDLEQQVALLANSQVDTKVRKLNVSHAVLTWQKKLCKLKKAVSLRLDMGNDIELVSKNYAFFKSVFKSLKKKLRYAKFVCINGVPRIYELCKLSVESSTSIDSVLVSFNKLNCLKLDEHNLLYDVYLYAMLNKISIISKQILADCVRTRFALKDSLKDVVDLSSVFLPSYAVGYNLNKDIRVRYKYNALLKQNNRSVSNLTMQYGVHKSQVGLQLYRLIQNMQETCSTGCCPNVPSSKLSHNDHVYFADLAQFTNYPKLNLLSNGSYVSAIDSSGCCRSFLRQTKLLDGHRYDGGFAIYCVVDGEVYSVYDNATHFANRTQFELETNDLKITTVAKVLFDTNCDVRLVEISNLSSIAKNVDIVVDCKVHSSLEVSYHLNQISFLKSKKIVGYLSVDGLKSTVSNGKIVGNLQVLPNSKREFSACIDMSQSNTLLKLSKLKQQTPSSRADCISQSALLVMTKLLYNLRLPYPQELLQFGLDIDLPTVCLKLSGEDFDGLIGKIKELRLVSRLIKFNLIVLYTQKKVLERYTHQLLQYSLDICDSLHCSSINAISINTMLTEQNVLELLSSFCIMFDESVNLLSLQSVPSQPQASCKKLPIEQVMSTKQALYGLDKKLDCLKYENQSVVLLPMLVDCNDYWFNHLSSHNISIATNQFGKIANGMQTKIVLGTGKYIWDTVASHHNIESPLSVECKFANNESVYTNQFLNIGSVVTISVKGSLMLYNLHLSNESDIAQEVAVLFFLELTSSYKFAYDITRQSKSVKILNNFDMTETFVDADFAIDSFCASKESFCNQYGQVVVVRDLKDCMGTTPCVALGCVVKLKARASKKLNFCISQSGKSKLSSFKKNIDISCVECDETLVQALNWLSICGQDDFYSAFVHNYTDYNLSMQILIEAANAGEMSPNFVYAVARHCKIVGNTKLMDCRILFKNSIVSLEGYCICILHSLSVLDKRGLVVQKDNKVSLFDSLTLLMCIQTVLPLLKDGVQYKYWSGVANKMQDVVNVNFWKETHYGTSKAKLDLRIQSLAVLCNLCDKRQRQVLYNTMYQVLNSNTFANFNVDSVHLFRALLSLDHSDLAYSLLKSMKLLSNKGCGVFAPNCTNWHSYLFDCIVECMLGLEISNKRVDFNPRLPGFVDQCKFQLSIAQQTVHVDVHNFDKIGEWCLTIDKVKHGLAGINLQSSLNGKTVVLTRRLAR